jgi:hypothetical protein
VGAVDGHVGERLGVLAVNEGPFLLGPRIPVRCEERAVAVERAAFAVGIRQLDPDRVVGEGARRSADRSDALDDERAARVEGATRSRLVCRPVPGGVRGCGEQVRHEGRRGGEAVPSRVQVVEPNELRAGPVAHDRAGELGLARSRPPIDQDATAHPHVVGPHDH